MGIEFSPRDELAEAIVRKWCLNLLVFLVLKGGGQRPQVYGVIQSPGTNELAQMEESAERTGYFTMITGLEKRPRPSYAPRFTLPAVCLKYIKYHCEHVRPFIVNTSNVTSSGEQDCLLLDTRTGKNLESKYVTPSLQAFVKRIDPDMGEKITTMDVRSSYATIRLMEFRQAATERKTNQSLESFMSDLAAVMNTSTTMLKDVYLAIDDDEFVRAAVNVHQYVRDEQEQEA